MKKFKILFIFFLTMSLGLTAQANINNELQTAVSVEKSQGAMIALKKYKSILEKYPNNIQALQNASLAASRLVKLQATAKLRLGFAQMAYNYANRAYKLDATNANSNYVLAVAEGLKAMESGINDKVKLAKNIQYHAKNTIKLDPNHKYGYHLVGKYYYELSQLSSVEKALASKMLGNIPNNSLDIAIEKMKKCYQISPTFIANMSDLALAYHKKGNDKTARYYLNKALNTPNLYPEDENVKSECRALLRVIQ